MYGRGWDGDGEADGALMTDRTWMASLMSSHS